MRMLIMIIIVVDAVDVVAAGRFRVMFVGRNVFEKLESLCPGRLQTVDILGGNFDLILAPDGVDEAAPASVQTGTIDVIKLAQLTLVLVVAQHDLELLSSVSELALVSVSAVAVLFPGPAHLGLVQAVLLVDNRGGGRGRS